MTALQTALAALEKSNIAAMKPPINTIKEYRRIVNAAARSVVEGKTIWWCEVHEMPKVGNMNGEDLCREVSSYRRPGEPSCSMVEKILADPPDKETE